MRSDKNNTPDPNREIDDFLSKFDDASDSGSEAFNNYLDDDHDKSSNNNFRWKEVKTPKSSGKRTKKDSAERKVTKDPAPSSIKVERNKTEDAVVHTYPVADIIEPAPNKPEAVEPERASDPIKKENKKKYHRKKRKNTKTDIKKPAHKEETTIEEVAPADVNIDKTKELDALFGIGDSDAPEEAMDILDVGTGDDASEGPNDSIITESSEEAKTEAVSDKHESKLRHLFSFLSKKEESPVAVEEKSEDLDLSALMEDSSNEDIHTEETAVEEISAEDISIEKSVSDDTPEEFAIEDDVIEEPEIESVPEEESSFEDIINEEASSEKDAQDETAEETDANKAALAAAAVLVPFNITNSPKKDRTPINTDYIRDAQSGEFRKIDLGKRKRIEHKVYDGAASGKKAVGALFGAKKEKKVKEKKKKVKKERRTLAQFLFCKKNKKYRPEEGATYQHNGKTVKNKKYKFSFLKLIGDFMFIGLLMAIAAAGVGYKLIKEAKEFNYSDVYETVATASVVYDDQGKQIDNIYYTENRRIVKYEDMPQDLINSVIAIEDKTFWKHHGFNWIRMVGAVWSAVTGNGQISGTSTITQQLSRNIYLPDEKSDRNLKRKFLEMYYAARLEHALSKEQIIEAYLNTIYLGYGCYGVNSAANTYFSKSVKDLNLVECAALAALPSQPHIYALLKNASEGGEVSEDSKVVAKSPEKVVTSDLSKDRRDLTLDLMLEQGLITQEAYKEAYNKPLNDFIEPNIKSATSNNIYFHDYLVDTLVADLMEQKNLSQEEAERLVYTGGLQIYSTLDTKAQNVVAKEFKDNSNFPSISAIWRQDYDGNILNNDGKIALYDYDDYFDEDGNFTFNADNEEIAFNSDGSATIKTGHNVYIYETQVGDTTDYSIEFKNYYVLKEGILYSIQGGYINIPQNYKSSDGNGNVIISADFFNEDQFKKSFKKDGNKLVISEVGYSLGQQIRQPQAAMVIVEVGTGQVKAMVGGRQFTGQRLLNRAVNCRQPGSSIKPLAVYGAALQKSYELEKEGKKWTYTNYKIDKQGTRGWGDYITVHSSVEDERTKVNGKYWPKNATGGFSGTNNFRTALQQSINTCAVKILHQVTPEYGFAQVKKFGITTVVDTKQNEKVNDVNLAAMGLGAMTEGVEPLEMALAYAAFPAGGKVNSPICYTKVLDKKGNVLIEGKSEQTEALNAGVAWIMTDVLKSVVSRGIAYNAAINDVDVGGKTGTTNDTYDIWFDGFTPNYAAALWIGTDQNIEMGSTSMTAALLWGNIMDQIPNAKKGKYKKMPKNVIEYYGDYYTEGTQTGLTSWSYAAEKKKAKQAAYKKWLKEREKHKIHHEAKTKTVTEDTNIYLPDTIKNDAEAIAYATEHNIKITELRIDKKTKKYYYIKKTQKEVVVKEAYDEYEKGWRDGDFTYKFDGQTFKD